MDLFGDLPPPKDTNTSGSNSESNLLFGGLAKSSEPNFSDNISSKRENEVEADAPPQKKQKIESEFHFLLESIHYGSKGRRQTMEDAVAELNDEDIRKSCPSLPEGVRFAFYAVYDGHGGSEIADFCCSVLHREVVKALSKNKYPYTLQQVRDALRNGFHATNELARTTATTSGWKGGCCAVSCLIINDDVYIANLGDSKAILCRRLPETERNQNGQSDSQHSNSRREHERNAGKPVSCCLGVHDYNCACTPAPAATIRTLTEDHKPIFRAEKDRIVKAGGFVEDGRAAGPGTPMLEVSRSIGDFPLKKYGVVATPDTRVHFKIKDEDEFLMLACDGLWTRYDKDAASAYVRDRLWAHHLHHSREEGGSCRRVGCVMREHKMTPKVVLKSLVDDTINKKECKDNVSVLLVRFRRSDELHS